ncbi:MAG: UDP-N-acetylmuramate--L-alanine ligase [Clostridia bacterium]|nr:UDP-N-acetylmuramate--L-alanine ligase [Clostridia bacterium]
MSVENTHEGPARIALYMKAARTVHFIGVGGVMMSSLAILTHRAGYTVTGSDRTPSKVTAGLEAEGITVFYAHDASNLTPDCGMVVYTVAISADNPEFAAAAERHIPCISRADYLGWLMTAYQNRVGVAGMHGKSTCTSMCTQLFLEAEADPTVLIGADFAPINGAFRLGGDRHFLFEACEYMDSFLDFRPTTAILLGAELEHVDYFKSMEQIETSFAGFASLTGPDGVTIVNADDPHSVKSARTALACGGTGRVITFGVQTADADFRAENPHLERGLPVFDLVVRGERWGTVKLRIPGIHHIYNALAAAAAADVSGLDRAPILRGLSCFAGVDRRMQYRGQVNGASVYDDYGHHPTEIRATLTGASALVGTAPDGTPGRLVCVFQPHTYSRTASLYDSFLTAFDPADRVFLLDIYAAREVNSFGVSSAGLASDIGSRAAYCASPAEAADALRQVLRPGDVAVIMGAGDVIKVSRILFE